MKQLTAPLKLSWLGSPLIERDNDAVHMETRKATALLAFLGLAPVPPSRERLAALFWPEFDQTHAHANLRRTLFSIKQLIGSGILASERENIGINPNSLIWQDVSEFRLLLENVKTHSHREINTCPTCLGDLEKTVSLYRGDFLDGVNLKDCPEFDDWQSLQREGFRSELAFSLERLAHVYTALGEWGQAIVKTRQWVSLDRLNEHAHRMLMQGYALAGQRSAALRQYEECARYLRDELGQSPEEETIALYDKVQTGEIGRSIKSIEMVSLQPQANSDRQPLIKTKLFAPHVPVSLISRSHLLAKLDQGGHGALTLISAPAGYGKTTLLSEWISARKKGGASFPWAVCWLSLDNGDNDPTRFLNYLMAALQNAYPGVGEEAQSLLQSSQTLQPQTPLSMLINDLQELPQQVSLVLDDYQFISHPSIHDGIAFLLEHLPTNVHLVISTRSDPPLPLARLRSRNQLHELRANDLRFSSEEAATFLKKVMDKSLTPEQTRTLENRTEGWIAGLQMAAISMQGRSDLATFIEAFSGSHRYIMDYLTEEALDRQTAGIQKFLLQTSILERLNGSLCDAILVGSDNKEQNTLQSESGFPNLFGESTRILTELELSNLFVLPLDESRTWYRYHHLFSDLLHSRLEQAHPEIIRTLHTRASAWFEKNGWIEESIRHSLAAKDWENACRLLERHVYAYLENGQLATIMQWIASVPQGAIHKHPKLSVRVAEIYAHAGMIDQIESFLGKAEETVAPRENRPPANGDAQEASLTQADVYRILVMIAMLRGLKCVFSGDPNRAISLTQSALKAIPEIELRELAWLHWVEGYAYRGLGNINLALGSFTRAAEYAHESGMALRDIWSDLGIVTRLAGRLPQAIDIFTHSLQIVADRGSPNQGNLSRDEALLSLIFLEHNQLDQALDHAHRAVAYTQWWPSHNHITSAYASLSQILIARGDLEGGIIAIQRADQERKGRLVTPYVHSMVDVTLAKIWIIRGDWAVADQWSSQLISTLNSRSEQGDGIDEYLEMRLIMLVRLWIEKTNADRSFDRYADALSLLARLENSSQASGRIASLIEVLILKESIRFLQRKTDEAIRGLERCLSLAEPGGYIRVFVNTGEPARALLSAYLQKSEPTHNRSYAVSILRAFGGSSQTGNGLSEFHELVTPREMEVLQLLAKGYSNRQMAEKLILSEGTIKFHVHNLLEKLQVDSRTRAIAKAKVLDLI